MADSSLQGQKTLWEKEKLLIMSNFFFSHSVFKSLVLQTCKNQGLFGKGLKTLKKQPFENIVGKDGIVWYSLTGVENASYQHFLLFPQCLLIYQEEKLSF